MGSVFGALLFPGIPTRGGEGVRVEEVPTRRNPGNS